MVYDGGVILPLQDSLAGTFRAWYEALSRDLVRTAGGDVILPMLAGWPRFQESATEALFALSDFEAAADGYSAELQVLLANRSAWATVALDRALRELKDEIPAERAMRQVVSYYRTLLKRRVWAPVDAARFGAVATACGTAGAGSCWDEADGLAGELIAA
jgi:hypothetical protein